MDSISRPRPRVRFPLDPSNGLEIPQSLNCPGYLEAGVTSKPVGSDDSANSLKCTSLDAT